MQLTMSERESAAVLVSCNGRLSYKFQRLREQLRSAILNGELDGRLPGERELARRYSANAKTINKALCDLSSDGLVVRRIGKGTFVCRRDMQPERQRLFACFGDQGSANDYRANLLGAVRKSLGARNCGLQIVDQLDGVIRHGFADAARKEVEGFFYYPFEPMSHGVTRNRDEYLSQALRRQLFCLVLGDCPQTIRVNAVSPDHTDAGFRLSEHLFSLGCGSIQVYLPPQESRGIELFMSGCATAAKRHQRSVHGTLVPQNGTNGTVHAAPLNGNGNGSANGNGNGSAHKTVGIIAVGTTIEAVHRLQQQGAIPAKSPIVAMSEPGDPLPAKLGWTSYHVDVERIADWAAKIAAEHRPGTRPMEILVPGVVQVRGGGICDTAAVRISEAVI
jgi:hypothetical protein